MVKGSRTDIETSPPYWVYILGTWYTILREAGGSRGGSWISGEVEAVAAFLCIVGWYDEEIITACVHGNCFGGISTAVAH
ncbi:MAG: hypothetical protein A2Y62_18480 [Candidatus Fischerbacteria bacterium RBG_13_37_8]|uniref:Uncharacterized protein n=1 Tax=Candidatus Fischerbacteria bacterium RBG_13_37_8 TaxID=1817863 RepID=A0A1F5V998_9BACT|nr:MAG: hypothetical protein A2Y62_18480 [Candidatus Fischerbacteria bacterium RBG_13_37_8]